MCDKSERKTMWKPAGVKNKCEIRLSINSTKKIFISLCLSLLSHIPEPGFPGIKM